MARPQYVYVTYIASTPEKVWAALMDPEMTKDYWGRARNVSTWRAGDRWEHRDYDDDGVVLVVGRVLEAVPPRRLVVTWSSPADEGKPEKTSRVTYTIDPAQQAVRLTVVHEDLDDASLGAVSQGWPAVLSSLKTMLETGHSLPGTRKPWGRG
jgi:uncharacterized protein YndB with AHSA1/START domain